MNYWDKLMGDDEHAADYMLTYNEGPDTLLRLEIAKYLEKDDSVLDVGAGPGWNMETFEGRIRRYKGTDYSDRFVRVSNQRRKQLYFDTTYALPFELQDCRDLKEPDNSWDVVIVQDCLEHTDGYEKPTREALRVARKRVIVTFWHLTDMDDPHINDDGDDGYGAWYDKREWEKFLDSLGYGWQLETIETGDNHRVRHIYVIDKEQHA